MPSVVRDPHDVVNTLFHLKHLLHIHGLFRLALSLYQVLVYLIGDDTNQIVKRDAL